MPWKSLAGSRTQLLPAPPPGKGGSGALASLRLWTFPGHCSSEILLRWGGHLSASASSPSLPLADSHFPGISHKLHPTAAFQFPNIFSASCPGCSLACDNSLCLAEPAPGRPAGSAPKTCWGHSPCWHHVSLLQHLGTWASVQAHFISKDMRILGHRPLRQLVVVADPSLLPSREAGLGVSSYLVYQ